MKSKELSRQYHICTSQLHELVAEFYEQLHTDDGAFPRSDWEDVIRLIGKFRVRVTHEIHGIKAACEEYNEDLDNAKRK